MGQVQAEFLYTRTRPMGPYLLLELGPFNKWVFYLNPKPAPQAASSHPPLRPSLKALNPIKKQIKKQKKILASHQKSQITAKPFSLIRGKLVTNHKDPCFHFPHFSFKKKKKKKEFINHQTKNNTTQPSNRNIHVKIRKLTQKKKNLGNKPKEVDVGLPNQGNFTFTVLR